MVSIFYDLETTDKDPIGQILNYSFIAVNDQFEIISELSGLIRISPLELPRAGAILANRVNVLKHQQTAVDSERDAMQKIASYILSVTEKSRGKVPLVGYNSSKFDLPYLRTSMIRNGVNPYFYGKVLSRDLLHCVRKLSVSRSDFPRTPEIGADADPERLSLRLETIATRLKLLKGAQTHESRDDVLLTIKLARELIKKYDTDVRTYEPYEVRKMHPKNKNEVLVLESNYPQYDLGNPDISVSRPQALLCANDRAALWVDLERFQESEDASAVSFINYNSSCFFVGKNLSTDTELCALAKKAMKKFSKLTPDNFFPEPTCDIEQHIYRMPFEWINKLADVLADESSSTGSQLKKNKDAYVLYVRSKLRNTCTPIPAENTRLNEVLKKYAEYRYSGNLQLAKELPEEDENSPESTMNFETHAPTLESLYSELNLALNEAHSKADRDLLIALKSFYDDSPMVLLLADNRRASARTA